MNKTIKRKFLQIVLGLVGLVLVFFLCKWLSRIMYGNSDRPGAGLAEQTTPQTEAKPALTEAQIEELFRHMRQELTAEAMKTEGAKGSSADTGDNNGGTGSRETSAQEEENGSEASMSGGELDFGALWEINEDIYAWITIPGTNIDYPILQHPTDDSYYLNYNIDGSYGHPGCIYTERLNSKEFTDSNTVIYGHNLKEKTMFTELHKFENRDFFAEHDEIIIYLPEKTLHYKVFAAHVYDDRHLLYSFDFSDKDIFAGYLQSIYDIRDMGANINRDFTVTAEDKIITLVTCMPKKADAAKRLLVQAVLTGED